MHNHFLKYRAQPVSKVLNDDKYCVHRHILKYRAHMVSKVVWQRLLILEYLSDKPLVNLTRRKFWVAQKLGSLLWQQISSR